MKQIGISIIILWQLNFLSSQSIPNHYFLYKTKNLLFDAGRDWEILSIFSPIRFHKESTNSVSNHKSSHTIEGRTGFTINNDILSLYGFGRLKYKDHFYMYLNPTYRDKGVEFNFIKQSVESINVPENISGIGFESSWATLEIVRGKESWGSGNDIQLALSNSSSPYDYFVLASDYGKIRVRYIHGFLENIMENVNRYIVARGFEWTNRKSFIIGFSETVIYSGENRPIDFGYINPMGSHLEIELNERLNIVDGNNANAAWQMHLDGLLNQHVRLSMNYLFDEFVIDKEQNGEEEKQHGKAYSFRLAYTPIFSNKHILTAYSSFIHVGTPTFRHSLGSNNFVHSGAPIGWYKGSDGQELSIGLNYFNRDNTIVSLSSGFFQSGEQSVTQRVYKAYEYEDYRNKSFPSGLINETFYIDTYISYLWEDYFTFSSGLYWYDDNKYGQGLDLRFSLNLFYIFSYNS